MDSNKIYLLPGNASRKLATQISQYWHRRIDGAKLPSDGSEAELEEWEKMLSSRVQNDVVMVKVDIGKFRDGEVSVVVNENIRGQDVFIVQSFYTGYCEVNKKDGSTVYEPGESVNDYLMALLLTVDACKRASAGSITAVIPYFGYARQDRKIQRAPISAKLAADMLTVAGVSRVVTMDLHAAQVQGFFNVPVDNLYGAVVAAKHLANVIAARVRTIEERKGLVVVSPDVGGAQRARKFRERLVKTLQEEYPRVGLDKKADGKDTTDEEKSKNEKWYVDLAIIDKVRKNPNEAEVMDVIGRVKGKTAIIVDDLIDTAGTLCKGAQALHDKGAKEIFAFCTHPVMSDKYDAKSGLTTVVEKLNQSHIDKLYVSDTIPLRPDQEACEKIEVLSQDYMFASAMDGIFNRKSVSQVFNEARSSTLIPNYQQ